MYQQLSIDAAEKVAVAPALSGLCGGTSVLTLRGEIPVEDLVTGDRVITRDSGVAVLRAIEVTEVEVNPIRILAGSLGHTRPDRDMTVLPDAQLHLRDWRAMALFGRLNALVPASRLIDGEFVAQQPRCRMRVHTLTFDAPHIIYCDGVEIGTGL
ncbi:MAG: hypothetical protein GW905_10445 [Rhodobacterales bacterium]|nr:hypothetical protein [Rhodobacterales bacterium]